jgi:hypothetical protein
MNVEKIIKEEVDILKTISVSPPVNIEKLQRNVLDNEIKDNFLCENSMKAVRMVVMNAIQNSMNNGVMNPVIAKWFTDLMLFAPPSQEGILLKGGIKYLGDTIVVKISKNKSVSLIHEFVVGLLLNNLRASIPNFMYVFGGFNCGEPKLDKNLKIENLCSTPGNTIYLVTEMINGKSLRETLSDVDLNIVDLYSYTFQVLLSLQMAQDTYEYCHYDLHLDNILIRVMRDKKNIEYRTVNSETRPSFWINTEKIATIIDYGYSRVTYNGKSYGIQNMKHYGIDNTFKPGIDVYRFLYSMFRALISLKSTYAEEYINIFLPLLFSKSNKDTRHFLSQEVLVKGDINEINYAYPSPGDIGIYNIRPIDVINYIEKEHDDIFDFIITLYPEKGYLSNTEECDSLYKIIKRLTTPPDKITPCSGDPWKDLPGHWKDKYGKDRYWFDCGTFIYDGNFNLVQFPKGMSLYHGSAALSYYNVEFPLGIDYYKPGVNSLSKEEKQLLNSNKVDDKVKENILKSKQKIDIGFYGDYEIAMAYSSKPINVTSPMPYELKCGINCISAYKLKKDITMLNLYDPFNLYVLFTQNYMKTEAVSIMANAYDIKTVNDFIDLYEKIRPAKLDKKTGKIERAGDIDISDDSFQRLQQAYDPFKRFIMKSKRGSLRDDNYLVPREILGIITKMGYDGIVNPRSPYLEGNFKGYYRFAELIFGENVLNFVIRDFSNKHDWQYFDTRRLFGEIGNLVKDLYNYKTSNIDFHAGDLYQHSIWTALFIQEMFILDSPWVEGIDTSYMPVLVMAGFLHDIGKGGDLIYIYYNKPDHPRDGFEYFKQKKKYMYEGEDGKLLSLDIPKLLKNINLDEESSNLIAFIILSHWEFGNAISQLNDTNLSKVSDNYVNIIRKMAKESEVKMPFYDLCRMAMLVSVCDIMASQPYISSASFANLTNKITIDPSKVVNNLNTYLLDYPYLVNKPKNHRGDFKFENFQIEEKGLKIRDFILRLQNMVD